MRVQRTADGRTNLHIWRAGQGYEAQKGAILRKEWTNLYCSILPQPTGEDVIQYHDVRKPLPFPDATFDAIYAFHIIEHLTPREAKHFVRELHRTLRPGGVCRLSTPDLEDICRAYLNCLEAFLVDPSDKNVMNYHWSKLELYDQIVRDKSGGGMSEAVLAGYYDPEYARRRFGDVFSEFGPEQPSAASEGQSKGRQLIQRLMGMTPHRLYSGITRRVRNRFVRWRRRKTLRLLRTDPRATLESNKWLYDQLSLRLLLEDAGFGRPVRKTYETSDIVNWERYDLDRSNLGDHAIEPSLYVEARKPEGASPELGRDAVDGV